MLPSWIMVLKLSKKVHFLQFCTDHGQKPKSVIKQFTYMDLKVLIKLFKKMLVYGGVSHHSWDISNWNIKNDADSAEI